MKKNTDHPMVSTDMQNTITDDVSAENKSINRRKFVEYVAASALKKLYRPQRPDYTGLYWNRYPGYQGIITTACKHTVPGYCRMRSQ
jgi:hypothetical protein